MEDDLKISKVQYLNNHLLDLSQLLNLSLGYHIKIENYCKWIQPPMEDDLKKKKGNISATTDWIFLKFET